MKGILQRTPVSSFMLSKTRSTIEVMSLGREDNTDTVMKEIELPNPTSALFMGMYVMFFKEMYLSREIACLATYNNIPSDTNRYCTLLFTFSRSIWLVCRRIPQVGQP